ncbi:autotransporter outer membrane beta-barrel domain-containing protein, partial [Roseomonas elaeocarpi]
RVAGGTLALTGQGSIATSDRVVADATFDISGTDTGASINSLAGSGSVVLGDRVLTVTGGHDSFAGNISGNGVLAVSGGVQAINGTNSYTGETRVAGGTLALTGQGSIATSDRVVADATFDISGTDTGASINSLAGSGSVVLGDRVLTVTGGHDSFAGNISGNGTFAVSGGVQELTGINTQAGGTLINGGTLVVGTDSALGASSGRLAMSNGTLVTTAPLSTARSIGLSGVNTLNTNSQAVALSGTVSGSGALVADGGGTLTLSGQNTYSGGTLVTGKTTLAVAADSALGDPSGALVIDSGKLLALDSFSSNRAISVHVDGVIDSNGYVLDLNGPITQQMSATSATETMVFDGTAKVNGSLTLNNSGLTVERNASLRGTGTVYRPTLVLGTLAPGNSPGTLVFTAPVTMAEGSMLSLDIDGTGTEKGAGNFSRVLVQGTDSSFTADGTLRPHLRGITGNASNTYTPPVGQGFRVVEAEGGVEGSFATLEQPTDALLPGSRFDVLYTPNTVDLYVTPQSYTDLTPFGVGLTANQTAVARGLDALRPVDAERVSAAATAVLGTLYSQVPQALPQVMNTLGGTVYGDALMAGLSRDRAFGAAIADQASLRRSDRAAEARTYTPWISGLGEQLHVGASGNTGYRSSAGGFAAGADMRLGAGLLAGLAVGYSEGKVTASDTGGQTRLGMLHLAAYGSWNRDRFFVDAQGGLNNTDAKTKRDLPTFGLVARGRDSSWGGSAAVETGGRFEFANWRVQPGVGLRVDTIDRDALTERGASVLSLRVGDDSATSLRGTVGFRAEARLRLAEGYDFLPNIRAHYAHDFADVTTTTSAAFTGAPDTGIRLASARTGRDGALLGAGFAVSLPVGASLYANYSADLRSNASAQSVTGGLRWSW